MDEILPKSHRMTFKNNKNRDRNSQQREELQHQLSRAAYRREKKWQTLKRSVYRRVITRLRFCVQPRLKDFRLNRYATSVMIHHLWVLAVTLVIANSLQFSSKRYAQSPFSCQKYRNTQLVISRLLGPSLSIGDDTSPEELSFGDEISKSPLEQFLHALQESITEETLLKLTLSENEFDDINTVDEITDYNEDEISVEVDDGADIDWQEVKEWAAISGRLIKTKSESKLQLISYKDKSMKKSDRSRNFSTVSEVIPLVSAYVRRAFKKVMLSTKDNDFEFKLRKGQGKFKATSKVKQYV